LFVGLYFLGSVNPGIILFVLLSVSIYRFKEDIMADSVPKVLLPVRNSSMWYWQADDYVDFMLRSVVSSDGADVPVRGTFLREWTTPDLVPFTRPINDSI